MAIAGGSILISDPVGARRSKMVDLRYGDVTTTLPMQDLLDLAETGEVSVELEEYLEAIPTTAERAAEILNATIVDGGLPIGRKEAEFLAIQLTRSIGDPLGRERLDDMVKSLRKSFDSDRIITLLEVAENYPDDTVRVDFRRLGRLQSDVEIFVERVQPVIGVIEELLPDLVCDCDLYNEEAVSSNVSNSGLIPKVWANISSKTSDTVQITNHSVNKNKDACLSSKQIQSLKRYRFAIAQLKSIVEQDANNPVLMQNSKFAGLHPYLSEGLDRSPFQLVEYRNTSEQGFIVQDSGVSDSVNVSTRIPDPIAETVILAVGPFRPSFAIRDLENFVETGTVPSGWRFYFNIAGINEEEFRTALTEEVDVDLMFMDNLLNNILGEYILFQVGQIIHKPSEDSNIQAIRSALILSAVNDGKISLLEFLRNYPSTDIIVEALNLARLGINLQNQGAVGTATAGIEDFLLELQAGVADDVCDCDDEELDS